MLNLTQPQYVMPVHGDYKRLRIHSRLAQAVGVPAENIFPGENGLPLEITSSGAEWGPRETRGWCSSTASTSATWPTSRCGTAACSARTGSSSSSRRCPSRTARRWSPPRCWRAACRSSTATRTSSTTSARRSRTPSTARRRADHGDRGARVDAPRRPRGVHLRQAQAAADGAAGRGGGLEGVDLDAVAVGVGEAGRGWGRRGRGLSSR